MLRGTDISHYQTAIPAGDFCILKATEGTGYVDPDFSHWWKTLGQRGTLRGAYHFAHPANDPVAEAHHFLNVVEGAGVKPGDWLVLDHETSGGSATHDAQWAVRWCAAVEATTGVRPVVYTFLSFAREGRCEGLGGYPLWIADPSAPVGHPRVPAPWKSWVMHQYSEVGGVDHDVFNGTADDWRKLGGLSVRPDPTPKEEEDMPHGVLNQVPAAPTGKAETPISTAPKKYTKLGLFADGGLLGEPPVKVRVAQHLTTLKWKIDHVIVDSTKAKVVLDVDPACDGLSISYEGDATVPVAWDMS